MIELVTSKSAANPSLLWAASRVLMGVDRLKESESLCESALKAVESKWRIRPGADALHDSLLAKQNLAEVLRATGDKKKLQYAKKLVDEVIHSVHDLKSSKVVFDVAERAVVTQADVFNELGNLEKAKDLYERWLGNHTKREGSEEVEAWTTMQLANVVWKLGDLKTADSLYKGCLRFWEDHYGRTGERHTNLYLCHGSYSTLLAQVGRMLESESHARIALDGRRETLGDNHLLTLRSYHNLATLLYEALESDVYPSWCLDYSEAEKAANIAALGRLKQLGEEDPDTKLSLRLLEALRAKASPPFGCEGINSFCSLIQTHGESCVVS